MTVTSLGNAIFVLGITPRSGTNFLYNLLSLHPDCRVPEPIWEDYLLEPSHLLLQYTRAVCRWWEGADPPWGVDRSFESLLCQYLGGGLISFLESRTGVRAGEGRLLTKTPCVSHVDNFFKLFPHAYLLILVRDGRDVVESALRTRGAWPDGVAKQWADAAESILRFDRVNRARGLRYMIVRYEDLYLNLDSELPKILDFLDLDIEVYDFSAARQLPVRGSSTHRGGKKQVHWERAVAKTRNFNPIRRWGNWDRRMHERFNWLAGQYLTEFGYEIESYSRHRRAWRMYNRAVDTVGKCGLSGLMPQFIWKLVKKAGHGLFRLAGVDAYHRVHKGA